MRIATETSLSPGWLLIAFPAVLYPPIWCWRRCSGGVWLRRRTSGVTSRRGGASCPMILGYLVMMVTYVARGTFRDLEALRPVLQGGEATYPDLRRQLTHFDAAPSVDRGIVGFSSPVLSGNCTGALDPLLGRGVVLQDACIVAIIIAGWILGGRGAMYIIDSARLYSRIGEQHVEVDLLDLHPLSPLTRHGLRIVLLLVIMMAFWMTIVAAIIGFSSTSGSIATIFLTSSGVPTGGCRLRSPGTWPPSSDPSPQGGGTRAGSRGDPPRPRAGRQARV